ncbi:putative Alpha/beta hydrolase fold-3 domain-containing protein [Seiridium unicorne]|uniref:Alpha/beta hydrolase fold-3 domain-containing protein n=1 Tax=Seiridium unicorne TaxID=138068 RepID=A0ABR2USF4_9PEZI
MSYHAWTKDRSLEPKGVSFPDGSQAFWIGSPTARTLVLYFHGGGWVLPGSSGHFEFIARIADRFSSAEVKHPVQLGQAAELLHYALSPSGLGSDPREIILMGDSAGGNLVVALLQHILSPHPTIEPVKLSSPLRGAVACSPLIDFDFTTDMHTRDSSLDPASTATLKRWTQDYIGPDSSADNWADPGRTSSADWLGLGHVVEKSLITAAQEEPLMNGIVEMANRLLV